MRIEDLAEKTIVFDWGKNGKQSFRVIKVNFQKPYRNYKWLLDCLETNTGTCFQTDEEREEYRKFSYYGAAGYRDNDFKEMVAVPSYEKIDWLNAHHFDYRGLIERGLAIKVTPDNNPYE